MKILEAKPWSHVINCKVCKSKLEIEENDVKEGEFGGSYCDSGEPHPYVVCPVCESHNIIPRNKITPKIEYMMRRK